MEKTKEYTYSVTKEQVEEHQKRSFEEILLWLHNTNAFLNVVQTEEEKLLRNKIRAGKG